MLLATLLLMSVPDVTPAAQSADKLICRLEYEAYSRIPKRICGTQAEWDQMYKDTQEDLRSSRNKRGSAPAGSKW